MGNIAGWKAGLGGKRSGIPHRHLTTKPVCLCYTPSTMTFNPTTSREDIRRLGIILASAGLLSAFLEGGDPLVAAGLAPVGIGALVLGNLEHNR